MIAIRKCRWRRKAPVTAAILRQRNRHPIKRNDGMRHVAVHVAYQERGLIVTRQMIGSVITRVITRVERNSRYGKLVIKGDRFRVAGGVPCSIFNGNGQRVISSDREYRRGDGPVTVGIFHHGTGKTVNRCRQADDIIRGGDVKYRLGSIRDAIGGRIPGICRQSDGINIHRGIHGEIICRRSLVSCFISNAYIQRIFPFNKGGFWSIGPTAIRLFLNGCRRAVQRHFDAVNICRHIA